MAGLIEAKLPTDDEDSPKVATYEPERIELDPATDTIEGRVDRIIAKNSAPMQSAETRALQSMASRGLLNSSMATEAAQRAVYDYAVPIASQDAQTSFQAKGLNQQAGNRAAEVGALGRQQAGQIEQQGLIQSRLQQERGEIEKALQSADANTRMQLLNRQAEIDAELQASGGDIQSRLQAERGEIEKQLQTADAATRERLLARQGEIDTQLQRERIVGELQAITVRAQEESKLQAERGQIELQLQSADAATRETLLQRQGEIDMALAAQRGQIEADLLWQRGAIDTGLEQLRQLGAANLTAQQAELEKQLIAARGEVDKQLTELRGQLDVQLQELRGEQANQLAVIEGQYKTLLQTSQSAALFYSQTSASMAEILANPDLTLANKQALIDKEIQLLEGGLGVIGGIANLDLTALIDFGTGGTIGGAGPGGALPTPTIGTSEDILADIANRLVGGFFA